MDRAEVLEAVLRSKPVADATASGTHAGATAVVTPSVFEWGTIRHLLREAQSPRIGRELMRLVRQKEDSAHRPDQQDEGAVGRDRPRRLLHGEQALLREPYNNNTSTSTRSSTSDNNDDDDDRTDGHNTDSGEIELFVDVLRAFLLRIRVAGQLRQESMVEKQLVELKSLCRGVCADFGTTAAVFHDLWDVVGQWRNVADTDQTSVESNRQAAPLAQDARIVSRAKEILRKAAAVDSTSKKDGAEAGDHASAEISSRRGHRPPPRTLSPSQGRSSFPTSPSDGSDKPGSPARDQTRERKGFVNSPADVLPLLVLAEAVGVAPAVEASLAYIATNEQAVAGAAAIHLGSPTATLPSAPPVDWTVAVQRLASWQRKIVRTCEAPSLPPKLTVSSSGEPTKRKTSLPLSPVSTASSTSSSSLQDFRRFEHSPRPRHVQDGQSVTFGAALVEQSTQWTDDEVEVETMRTVDATAVSHQGSHADCRGFSRGLERKGGLENAESCESRRVFVGGCSRTADNDDVIVAPSSVTARPVVEANRRSPTRWSEQIRRHEMLRPLERKPSRVRRVSWHTSLATSPPPPPPSPPPWPEARMEGSLDCFVEGGTNGHVSGPSNVGAGIFGEGCHRQETVEGLVELPSREGCSMRRGREDEVRHFGRERCGGEGDTQVTREFASADTTRFTTRDLGEQGIIGDAHQEEVRSSDSGGDGDVQRRWYDGCCHPSDDDGCRNDGTFPWRLGKPEATERTVQPARAMRRAGQTSVPGTHSGNHSPYQPPRPFGARFEEATWRRRNSNGCSRDDDGHDDFDIAEDEGQVQPAPKSRSNTRLSGIVSSPMLNREESGIDDDDANEEESSCALARKRALLRVRLARQRQNLATAAVDANERGLRAERRRRREEKLAALLIKARRDDDFCGSCAGPEDGSISGGRRSALGSYPGGYRRPEDNKRDEFPQRRCGSMRLGVVGGMRRSDSAEKRCMDVLVGHRQEAPAGEEDEDEDRVPRQPLKVTPVAAACGSRSGYWRIGDRKEEGEDEGGRSFGGGGRGGGEIAPVDRYRSCAHSSPTSCSMVVRVHALYSNRIRYFGGEKGDIGVYLVLEASRLRHRTATQPRQETDRASHDCDAVRMNEGNSDGEGAKKRDQNGGGLKDDCATTKTDAWFFRETIALRLAEENGTGGQKVWHVPVPEDDDGENTMSGNFGDNILRVRVYVAGNLRQSRGVFSPPRCLASRPHRTPTHEGTDTTTPAASASAAAAADTPDELVGFAAIPLPRLAAAGSGAGSIRRPLEKEHCTFSRSTTVAVATTNGVQVGWIELGMCCASAIQGRAIDNLPTGRTTGMQMR